MEIPPLMWLSSDDYQPTQSDRCEGEAWQCLNCGNYIDGVILANRLAPPRLPCGEEAAVSAAENLVGGLMSGPTVGNALLVTDFTVHVSGFFPSEIERSA